MLNVSDSLSKVSEWLRRRSLVTVTVAFFGKCGIKTLEHNQAAIGKRKKWRKLVVSGKKTRSQDWVSKMEN
jgi:hypothetical protein